jgi:glutamine synthetase
VAAATGMLTLAELTKLVENREIDTVIMAFTDMQGRLVGKRASARLFLEDLAKHGAECCNYLLAVDVENNTVDGYPISSWETGYGDMVMNPDMATLRIIPWQPATALVMCNLSLTDSTPVAQSPREILKTQIARLAEKGLVPFVGTELEFIVFDNTYRDAWAKGYNGLTPSSDYNIDYAILASTRMEPLLRDIRNGMDGAGMYCEGVKGECNLGQQEIAFRYAGALETCDNHSIYKNGAKEIADQHGKALTFMAKYNQREGNSCHIHLSVRAADGTAVMAGDGKYGFSKLMEHWLAGLLATTRELSLFFAPNIN